MLNSCRIWSTTQLNIPPPPQPHTLCISVYTVRLLWEGGRGGRGQREGRGATIHKRGRIPTWLTVSPVYKLYLTPVWTTFRGLCRCSSFVHALYCQVSDEVTALATTLAHHTMDRRMKTVRNRQRNRTPLTNKQTNKQILSISLETDLAGFFHTRRVQMSSFLTKIKKIFTAYVFLAVCGLSWDTPISK